MSQDQTHLTTMTANRNGRKTLAVLVVIGCFIMAILFSTYGYEMTWRLWNVPTMMPYFADARVITAGAEAHALGYDPLINNPGSAIMNYPRVWQLLFYLGLDQSDTIYFGIVFAVLFFCGLFLVTNNIDRLTAALMMCGIFSPAVLLGLERGNNDLAVFFLLALAVYAIRKSRLATVAIIGFAFLLKLYPVFALAIFLREPKRFFRMIAVLSIIFCSIYSVVMFDELRSIRLATPKPTGLSYGLDVAWMRIGDSQPLGSTKEVLTTSVISATARLRHASLGLRIISYLAVVFATAFSLVHAGRSTNLVDDYYGHLDAFRVGAAIYVGTFMIGANFDYRLMMLLLVIPQLICWRNSTQIYLRRVAATTVVCIMISLWSRFSGLIFGHFAGGFLVSGLVAALSKWAVFFGLLYLFFYSLPAWAKGLIALRLGSNMALKPGTNADPFLQVQ